MAAQRQILAGAAFLALGAVPAAYFMSRSTTVISGPNNEEPARDAGIIAWCAEGLEPINGGGCFAPPAGVPKDGPAPLLIYLHGLFEPSAIADEHDRQKRVAKLATARGFGVLAFRGHIGQ